MICYALVSKMSIEGDKEFFFFVIFFSFWSIFERSWMSAAVDRGCKLSISFKDWQSKFVLCWLTRSGSILLTLRFCDASHAVPATSLASAEKAFSRGSSADTSGDP